MGAHFEMMLDTQALRQVMYKKDMRESAMMDKLMKHDAEKRKEAKKRKVP